MANIKVELFNELIDGQPVTFMAPCNCTEVNGLKVCYPGGSKEFTFKDTHGNELTGLGNLFAKGAYVKVILDVINGFAYLQNADTNAYIENTFTKKAEFYSTLDAQDKHNQDLYATKAELSQVHDGMEQGFLNMNTELSGVKEAYTKKNPVYTADANSLLRVISTAEPNSTIRLLNEGTYKLLTLTNVKHDGQNLNGSDKPVAVKFPENLTIVGEKGVKIPGISITCGVKDTDINHDHSANRNDADISNAILPRGLTIKNVAFTDHFSLRNASIDDLTLDGCTFAEGASISVDPNRMWDCYGRDTSLAPNEVNFEVRIPCAILTPKNLVIKDCVIENANGHTQNLDGSGDSAIRVIGVDGIVIYRNTINGAGYNGINISGYTDRTRVYATGKIAITNNIIRNTTDRAIRLLRTKDATVMLHNNDLFAINGGSGDYAKLASYCTDIVFDIGDAGTAFGNTGDGNPIGVGSGITTESTTSVVRIEQSGISGKWYYRKYTDGFAECWGTFSSKISLSHGDGLGQINLSIPFEFNNSLLAPNVQITLDRPSDNNPSTIPELFDIFLGSGTTLSLYITNTDATKVINGNVYIAGMWK